MIQAILQIPAASNLFLETPYGNLQLIFGVLAVLLLALAILGARLFRSRQLANAALRQSEAKYRTLFESIEEGFCIIEMIFDEHDRPVDYRFLEINPSFEKQSGIRDGLGKTIRGLVPQLEGSWIEAFGRVSITGEPVRIQDRAEQLNRSFDVYAFRFGDPKNRQVAILFTDITQRKQAEEERRQSEEDLAVTLHSIGDAVLTTDTAGRITRMNPVAEQLTGWVHTDALGRPVAEVFRIINEDTRQPASIPVDKVLQTGEIQGLANHTCLVSRDGTEWPIADSAAPIRGKEGHVLGVVLVFRAVTAERAAQKALQESEARYRTLFESLDEGFCIIGMIFDELGNPVDYRFLEINPSFEKQTGLRDAVGKRMLELAPKHESHWFEIYGRIATTGEPARFQNRAEQLNRTYDVYAFRFGDPKDRQVAILFNDITASKDAEDRISKLNADLKARASELLEANKELESFSSTVSHDLRAPLRHIQGYVGMLRSELPPELSEKAQRYLHTITKSSVEMGQLIDDLLAFSRTGRTEMHQESVELGTLVESTISGLEMATKGRKITWKLAPLPRVLGDSSMLRQVFANLIGNAVKYSRLRDQVEIEVGCSGEMEGQSILYVRDNGAGFDMQYAQKLFGVFQRLHGSDEFEGTGIGLATVHRIIARHGGRVWAEGKVGEGATFYFTLKPAATR